MRCHSTIQVDSQVSASMGLSRMARADMDCLRKQRYHESRLATEAAVSKINTPCDGRSIDPSMKTTTVGSSSYYRGEKLIDSITTLDHLLPKSQQW